MIACKLCIMKKGLKGSDRPQNCDYVFFNEKDLEKHLLDVHNVYTVDKNG